MPKMYWHTYDPFVALTAATRDFDFVHVSTSAGIEGATPQVIEGYFHQFT